MEIGLLFQEITFITEFPGSNFLLTTFLADGKWDFQVANLLFGMLISNPGMAVVVLLFYVHGKHLRSCRDSQVT